ncbi:MAG: protein translocase subunit SecF, partial [Chitinophagales bacterium]
QGEIGGGRSQITGNFTIKTAKDLANIIKAGKLPAPAKIVEEEIVGPSLGAESIRAGSLSLAIGLVLVLLFMIAYYSTAGIVSNVVLVLNLFFIMGVLASFGASLTLPGIAGIVLTIGMAVDANVIIFERIREELIRGKGLRLAISDGYNASYSAIIDANVTTLITGFILLFFGLGPVKGFATVLVIGIFSSLITAVLVSRLIIDKFTDREKGIKFFNKFSEGFFKNLDLKLLDKRKIAYGLSSIVIILGLVSMMTKGFQMGVDFQGGRSYVVRFDQSVKAVDISKALEDEFEAAPQVKTYGADNQVKITTAYRINEDGIEIDGEIEELLYSGVKEFFVEQPDKETFLAEHKMSSIKVGPTIADDILKGAYFAAVFSFIGIFLYILVRFRKWQFGLGALAAVVHDMLIVLSIFSIFGGILPFSLEIDQAFIAALLTVIGYSINDTVVVFDRIREYINLHPTTGITGTANMAIDHTLSRTLITSLTTLFVVVILFIFGGEVIRGFSFALLIGIIVGTYSSVFIASPIAVDTLKKAGTK